MEKTKMPTGDDMENNHLKFAIIIGMNNKTMIFRNDGQCILLFTFVADISKGYIELDKRY
ncbi:hypothetical protein [Youngiibacter fragilis]|uniref:Uncharacterized protein n=1 Tax=Youngiibacter fragilis 232.1 TaxID=994573 RepID=V7I5I4_9CLOT|nr:hypothetical protein [Youngiibacter fragilis]ETA81510.1 hypothetical protein T472_0206165 [Youngiibacter fragilis 232.1]